MSVATVRPKIDTEETRLNRFGNVALLLLILTYFIVWVATRAHFMADTIVYAEAILVHQHGGGSVDYRLLTSNPFWDFGHVLWRPFGWLCFVITKPVTRLFAEHSEQGQVILTLIGINFVAGLACVCFFSLLAKRVVGPTWSAALATLGLLSADAFLNYAHSGSPYEVGIACLVAGTYFSFGEIFPASSMASAFVAAVMLDLAVLFWFPYAFVLPASILAPALIRGQDLWRRRFAAQTFAACVVIGVVVYAPTIAILGIRNIADLRDWILASGHGHVQPGGLRLLARVAFSVPRSFVNMNRDGIWLKRYLLHDPYAPVTRADLLRLSLWKLAVFYLSAGIVCIELLLSKPGRTLLLVLASAALPILIFAAFIFEAGSIERYLPLYPFVFLACGYVLAATKTTRVSKLLIVVTLMVTAVVNINAMRTATLESVKTRATSRIQDLVPLLGPNSLVMAVNEQDSLAEFRQNFPLDPINLTGQWRTYDMLEINSERLSTWREDFAKQVLAAWRRGGTVWLPERVLRSRPSPDWNWVEGDDKRVRWADLPLFFSQLRKGQLVGGEDGFVSIDNDPTNREFLTRLAEK